MESWASSLNIAGLEPEEPSSPGGKSREKDGPFAWLIVACAFLCFSLMAINSVSFGIFITELEVTFNLSRSIIGVIGACKLGLSTFAGLVSGPLVKRFGCRVVCYAGILLATVGHLAAAFSDNVVGILITFGIMAGAGAGLAFIPTVVIVQQHFDKKRALAAGIASTGVSGFAIAFSPLTRYLINVLGWRGALIMLAAVNVQMFVPASFFRPPRSTTFKVRVINNADNDSKKTAKLPDILINRLDKSTPPSSPGGTRRDVTAPVTKQKLLLPPAEVEEPPPPRHCSGCQQCAFCDPSILTRPFVLFLITGIAIMYSMDAYYLRSAARAISFGVTPLQASWLPSVVGLASLVGRVLSGVAARALSPFSVNGVACTLCGLVVCLSVPSPAIFWVHAVFCAVFGLMFGISQGIQPTVVVSLLGVEKLPLGMSWSLLLGGVGRITANIVSGWLYDITGDYRAPLLVSALLLLLAGSAALVNACVRHRKQTRLERKAEAV